MLPNQYRVLDVPMELNSLDEPVAVFGRLPVERRRGSIHDGAEFVTEIMRHWGRRQIQEVGSREMQLSRAISLEERETFAQVIIA